MVKTVLTFGDSNTHGTKPTAVWGEEGRFGPTERWPGVAACALGPDWDVIEEGLPGRTATAQISPTMGPHMNGVLGLQIALNSHIPLDVLTIMLGTNDCQTQYGLSAEAIAGQIAGLLAIAKRPEMQAMHGGFKILLIAPPVIREEGIYVEGLMHAAAKSAALPALLADLADHCGVEFLDASILIKSCAEDGVHFDGAAHRTLGRAVADRIATL